MNWTLFTSTFGLIFLAELPDKTAFATLLLATNNPPLAVFLGASGAFLVQSVVAVAFGTLFSYLPERVVHVGAGALFLLFAVLMWRRGADGDGEDGAAKSVPGFWKATLGAFLVIFVAEWGDLTQLATATLVAKYQDWVTVGVAATLALWTVTGFGVLIGSQAARWLNPAVLQRVAAGAMALVGIYLLAWG